MDIDVSKPDDSEVPIPKWALWAFGGFCALMLAIATLAVTAIPWGYDIRSDVSVIRTMASEVDRRVGRLELQHDRHDERIRANEGAVIRLQSGRAEDVVHDGLVPPPLPPVLRGDFVLPGDPEGRYLGMNRGLGH